MKVVYANDARFIVGNGEEIYTEHRFTYELWKRYQFEQVIVAARMIEMSPQKQIERLDKASGSGIYFEKIPNIHSLVDRLRNTRYVKQKISDLLDNSDALIARLPSEIGFVAVEVALKLKKPWAIEVVGHIWDSYWNYGTINGKLYAPFSMLKMRSIVKKAPFAIYVTESYLQQSFPSSGITASASNVEIPQVSEDVLVKRKRKIVETCSSITIGLIGALYAKYKGIDTAIDAIKILKEKVTIEIKLMVLGGGDPKPWQLKADSVGLSKHIEFCGTVPSGNAVSEWLDMIDLYIQPSLTEGLPRSLIEAMSRGCPSIGSTAGGIPELLESNLLHKPKDAEQLARLLYNFIQNKDLQLQQAIRNFQFAKRYNKELLDNKRHQFWKQFKHHVSQGSECRDGKEII